MTTYTTATAVKDFTALDKLAALDGAEIDKLIEQAERDIDGAVGHYTIEDGETLKFSPITKLDTAQRGTLSDATCAQVEYRFVMGPEFFIRAQQTRVKGPEFETEGTLPYVGPGTWRELEGSGLLRLTTSWGGRGEDPPWRNFAYG